MAEGFNDWAFDLRPSIKANQGITLEAIELPDSYKETCLFLMAVEPYLLHATWDVAPEVFEELQVTFLLEAFAGRTVAVSCWVSPTLMDAEVGLMLTDVTGTITALNVTSLK